MKKLGRLVPNNREHWRQFDWTSWWKWTQLWGYCVGCCFSIPRSERTALGQGQSVIQGRARHLVSVVGVHEVEGGRGRAAQGRHQFRLGFGTRAFCSAWIRDGEGGRWSQGLGGRSRGQAAQPVGHRVCVELDLRVVEVLFTVAVIRVPNTPNAKESKTVRRCLARRLCPLSGMLFLLVSAWKTLTHPATPNCPLPGKTSWRLRGLYSNNQPSNYLFNNYLRICSV